MAEQVSIHDFKRRLQGLKNQERIPFEAFIEVTYGCNLRCVHCYNPTHKALPDELKTPEIFSLLEQLAESGSLSVTFTGGEPLSRPDIWDLMFYARKLGFLMTLNTNATLITPLILEKLQDLAPVLIAVSVYGITQSTYETVTRVPGSFQKFMAGLKLLRSSGLPLQFKMPVMTSNSHELDEAYAWFKNENLPFVHSLEIHPGTDGSQEPLEYRLPSAEAAKIRQRFQSSDGCSRIKSGLNGLQPEPDFFSCACGKSSLAVTPYGELNLCVSNPYPRYSLRTGSLKEGWNILVNFVEHFRPSEKYECPQCEFSDQCTQGPMDAFLQTGDFNRCLPYFKETAKQVKSSETLERFR